MDEPLTKTLFKHLPGQTVRHPLTGEELLLTTPSFRIGNTRFLKSRGLQLLNALAALKVQVLGSFWLPGMHIYRCEDLLPLTNDLKELKQGLFVGVTSAPMQEKGWYSFQGDPIMVVENVWSDVSDYQSSFKKKYRSRYKKALSLSTKLTVSRVTSADEFRICADLFHHTLAPKVAALPENLATFLGDFSQWFGAQYEVMAAKDSNGEILGFIGHLKDGKVLRAMHYGAAEKAPEGLYSLLMFETIHRGIQGGFTEINLGRTATEIKSTYGAVARDNYFSFYTRRPLLKMILRAAKKRYKLKEFTLRSPFKDAV